MKVLTPTVLTYLKVLLLVAVVPAVVGFVVVLAERRIMGFMQDRLGPNRVGPKGALQGLADLVKLVTKEDLTPAKAEKAVHFLAPVLAVIPALTALALIPFGPSVRIAPRVSTPLYVTDVNIGLLFILAITSIGVYGIILGGWASNSKYSLLGGLRSAAQHPHFSSLATSGAGKSSTYPRSSPLDDLSREFTTLAGSRGGTR